jgi:hypothetical protein
VANLKNYEVFILKETVRTWRSLKKVNGGGCKRDLNVKKCWNKVGKLIEVKVYVGG